MPLPRISEQAAAQIAELVAAHDLELLQFITAGGRPPSVNRLLSQLRPLVEAAVEAAVLQVDPEATSAQIAELVAAQLAVIRSTLVAAERDARRARRQVPRGRLPTQNDGETLGGFVLRVGAVGALASLVVAASRNRPGRRLARPPDRVRTGGAATDVQAKQAAQIRKLARQTGAPLPKPSAAYLRMRVRTDTAIGRNQVAAAAADRDDKVIRVLDARKGPTDEACEDVNGRYATPLWLRRHPVEHPNCTRLGRPVKLPAGQYVTLLE